MGAYENTGETFLALFFLVIAGPFVSHATIRAIRVREKGDWRPGKSPGNGPGKSPAKVPSGEREE
jgi:multisubunit Na+/H+ antiporter MnhG subunit